MVTVSELEVKACFGLISLKDPRPYNNNIDIIIIRSPPQPPTSSSCSLPPKNSIASQNSATSWGPSVQMHMLTGHILRLHPRRALDWARTACYLGFVPRGNSAWLSTLPMGTLQRAKVFISCAKWPPSERSNFQES